MIFMVFVSLLFLSLMIFMFFIVFYCVSIVFKCFFHRCENSDIALLADIECTGLLGKRKVSMLPSWTALKADRSAVRLEQLQHRQENLISMRTGLRVDSRVGFVAQKKLVPAGRASLALACTMAVAISSR